MITTKSIKEEIANNLLFYRKKNHLTQKELAEKIGVKHNAISSWENGTNSIDIETLFDICEIFGISINEIYGIKDNSVNNTNNLLTKKYNSLDEKGQHTINTVLEMEYNRCQEEQSTIKKIDTKNLNKLYLGDDIYYTVDEYTIKEIITKINHNHSPDEPASTLENYLKELIHQ